ncbi:MULTISPECIES: acyl carrier protein [Amycolatopsis]|uniref:Carrier domain-containing protein n=1 Tax=Amycolatopsis bullii TaxID=941987 RepID=A0ABQ3KE07_9PSEU|nr:acyl carrier protein [Amycolatopsis bullii]GHG14377.1 hypothetical protein GCM10017567_35230 [Amycolatopsis bullii]
MAPHELHAIVVDTVAAVLAIDSESVGDSLAALPTFDSFSMIEIAERLEQRLGVELDAHDLTPANLGHVTRLCRLFERTAAAANT